MISRRSLLALAVTPSIFAASPFRYDDLATDLPVTRLTDPAVTSILPPASAHPIGKNSLLFASDASGRFQPYRMDLKKGEEKQIGEAVGLKPESLTALGENSLCYFDEDRLVMSTKSSHVYKATDGFLPSGDLHVSVDGLFVAFVERRSATYRLRLINVRTSMAATLAEADEEMSDPITRPKRASVLYRRGGGLYLANFDGKQNYRLRSAEAAQAMWSPEGRSVLYLSSGKLREFVPDSNEDRAVADTSQFAAFDRNGDASVFVGAGGSKVSPYIFLLVRAVKRELTLCEHRASNPTMVNPMFSPNSQQIYFNSDIHGKPAIYRMDVEKLVAATA